MVNHCEHLDSVQGGATMPTRLDWAICSCSWKEPSLWSLGGIFIREVACFWKLEGRDLWNSDSKANCSIFCHIQLILVGIFQIDSSLWWVSLRGHQAFNWNLWPYPFTKTFGCSARHLDKVPTDAGGTDLRASELQVQHICWSRHQQWISEMLKSHRCLLASLEAVGFWFDLAKDSNFPDSGQVVSYSQVRMWQNSTLHQPPAWIQRENWVNHAMACCFTTDTRMKWTPRELPRWARDSWSLMERWRMVERMVPSDTAILDVCW